MSATRIAIATLGCKVNQYDSVALIERLGATSFSVVPFGELADIYIINTCTVTARTDYQSRQLIRRANRLNPGAKIIVTGCYAQRAAAEVAELPGVTLVAGNSEKDDIPLLAGEIGPGKTKVAVRDIRGRSEISPSTARSFAGRTRAFLRVQDGCDSFCTYCVVPYTRGRSRSLPESSVLEEVAALAVSGYREVVLSGIHLGLYGRDLSPSSDLVGLLRKIDKSRTTPRLRLSSIEPMEITPELVAHLQTSPNLCRHLHIPLQSGDDDILKFMGRQYGRKDFYTLVAGITAAVPDVAIGIDVMVGFPGEDENHFTHTCKLIDDLPVAYLHVFPYSRRPGTPAADFPHQVKECVKKERAAILRALGNRKRQDFAVRFLGRRLSVLLEARTDRARGYRKGFSDQYIPVLVRNVDPSLLNRLIDVIAEEACDGQIVGRVVDHG